MPQITRPDVSAPPRDACADDGLGTAPVGTGQLTAIVFSKDRALQLDATLASLLARCLDAEQVEICVLYRTSRAHQDQLYRQLIGRYPRVTFRKERHFREDLLGLIGKRPFVAFIVDDAIFVRDFSFQTVIEELRADDLALGFSLRLGTNTTYCYPLDARQLLPEFADRRRGVLAYRWPGASHDFGYPLELSSSVYRTADIESLLGNLSFTNPNTLELRLSTSAHTVSSMRPLLLCYERSRAFCIPANRVQNVISNRTSNNPNEAPRALDAAFEVGSRVDVARYYDFPNIACHQEVPLWIHQPDSQSRDEGIPTVRPTADMGAAFTVSPARARNRTWERLVRLVRRDRA